MKRISHLIAVMATALCGLGAQAQTPVDTVEHEVLLETTKGNIRVKLFNDTPRHRDHFMKLVREGYYNGLLFHRVIPGFMIQGGDPKGSGVGGPGYCIRGEFTANGFENNLKHDRGVLSMARTMAANSAGSQFFIMHENSPHLDGQYAAFGKVIEGIEAVDTIANTRTDYNDKPRTPQVMKKVTVETFGEEYPEPKKR